MYENGGFWQYSKQCIEIFSYRHIPAHTLNQNWFDTETVHCIYSSFQSTTHQISRQQCCKHNKYIRTVYLIIKLMFVLLLTSLIDFFYYHWVYYFGEKLSLPEKNLIPPYSVWGSFKINEYKQRDWHCTQTASCANIWKMFMM